MTLNEGNLNKSEYRQLKISVDAQIAKAFKEACSAAGVSMIAVYGDLQQSFNRKKAISANGY